MDRDPYDWLLESYIWRFSTTGKLGRETSREDLARAVSDILQGIQGCARRAELAQRREEFREIVYRVVNNVRRIREVTQAELPGVQAALDVLEKEYDAIDPRERGLDDVVDWAASSVSAEDIGAVEPGQSTTLTLIVQRRLEELVAVAQEGHFLAEAFISPPDSIRWTCGGETSDTRPAVGVWMGSLSGELSVRFAQTRYFQQPRQFEHKYAFDMTCSPGEYRFDFNLRNAADERASFLVDRGFFRGQKRLGHPGETVISVGREAWIGGNYQILNVYMPAIMRIQMFDALCVWLKDVGSRH